MPKSFFQSASLPGIQHAANLLIRRVNHISLADGRGVLTTADPVEASSLRRADDPRRQAGCQEQREECRKIDPITALTLISTSVQVAGQIKELLDKGSVTQQSLETAVPQIVPQLASLGASLFPKVAPELQAVAAASATFDPNVTKWLQGSLNKLLTPSPNLEVDGVYGPKTQEAVEAAQKQLGIPVDGWAGEVTQGAIMAALTKH